MLFYILLGVSGATGQIFHKNAFFRKNGIPIGLLCFYEILNLAMYFLFLLKSVTRTNTYNPQGISMIWRQVDTEFPKIMKISEFHEFYDIFINFVEIHGFYDFREHHGKS